MCSQETCTSNYKSLCEYTLKIEEMMANLLVLVLLVGILPVKHICLCKHRMWAQALTTFQVWAVTNRALLSITSQAEK